MVPTSTMVAELRGRGVDASLFRPGRKDFLPDERPVSIFVGRVAVEKNEEAFLDLAIPGSKYVVGDGPDTSVLLGRYPGARFVGYRYGEDLAAHLAAADVMVFPSRTDTFGLTMLEAMACGVPVAAYPVFGPQDVVTEGVTGALDEDLASAVRRALEINPDGCVAHAGRHSWESCAEQFLGYLVPVEAGTSAAAVRVRCSPQ